MKGKIRKPSTKWKTKDAINFTVSQTDARFVGIDVEEDAFVANFRLGSKANQAADVRIRRAIWWRFGRFWRCCCRCCGHSSFFGSFAFLPHKTEMLRIRNKLNNVIFMLKRDLEDVLTKSKLKPLKSKYGKCTWELLLHNDYLFENLKIKF